MEEVASLVLARRRAGIFWENTGFFTQPQAKNFCFLRDQNSAIYTHLLHSPPQTKTTGVLLGSKWCHIYTFWCFWGVKMLPYIHILGDFLDQNAAIYTHFGGYFGSKRCHIYIFLEFNFFRKNEKKINNRVRILLLFFWLSVFFWSFFLATL